MSDEIEKPEGEEDKSKRLSDAEWVEVVNLWELGTHSLGDLETKYGISESAISRGLKRRNAVKGCRAQEVAEEISKAAIDKAKARFKDIANMKNQYRGYTDILVKLAMKAIVEAQKNGGAIHIADPTMKTLKTAMQIVALGREENYQIFDLYKDNASEDELKELKVRVLTEEEIREIQAAQSIDPNALLAELEEATGSSIVEIDDEDVVEES